MRRLIGLFLLIQFVCSCDSIKRGAEFLFNRYRISTPSMSPTLNVGDRVAVVSVDTLKRNQIVAFYPPDKYDPNEEKAIWLSRLVALPGEEAQMNKGKLMINGNPYPFKLNLKNEYLVTTSMPLNEKKMADFEFQNLGQNQYRFFASIDELAAVRKNGAVLNIEERISNYDMNVVFGESVDEWGPVRLPKSGDVILVSEANLKMVMALAEFENLTDIQIQQEIKVSHDYFLMISDNRHNALDGRYLGLLPRGNIVGIALTK